MLESPLQPEYYTSMELLYPSFNPCYAGIASATSWYDSQCCKTHPSFNPCYAGIASATFIYHKESEVILYPFQSLLCWNRLCNQIRTNNPQGTWQEFQSLLCWNSLCFFFNHTATP